MHYQLRKTYLAVFGSPYQPAADHILERFEIFGSMVRWFHGSMVPWFHGSISKCFAAAPVFLFRATRHFVLFSCEFKISAEVIVHRMFAVFLNSVNGKNSSRTIVRDIFSVFFYARFQDQLQRVLFVTQIVISGIRIVICDRRVLYVYLTGE